jgi:hypothetical protein
MEDKYSLNELEEKELISNGIVIFDTSALLNLYEYSDHARTNIFESILTEFPNRLWIPYKVTSEYLKNREKPIEKSIKHYNSLKDNLKSIADLFKQIENTTSKQEKHPIINKTITTGFKSNLEIFKKEFEEELSNKIDELIKTKENDLIYNFINQNFQKGTPYSFAETNRNSERR